MDIKIADVITSAAGSFIGGMLVVWVTLGTAGIRDVRSKFGRPRIMAQKRRAPEDLFFGIELGAPASAVRDLLGTPSRTREKWWGYRFVDGLISIEFADDQSVLTLALAITNSDATFSFPWFEDYPPLGTLTLDRVIFEQTDLTFRESLRHQELVTYTRAGPTGAWINYTFGALSPLAQGDLADTHFDWDRETETLKTPTNEVRVNWVAISAMSGPAFFPWDLGVAHVGA